MKKVRTPGEGGCGRSVDSASCSFWVQARPRSGRESIGGWNEEGFLEVRLTSPPAGGKANEECRELLARVLAIPRSRVVLEKGHTARKKRFRVDGLGREEAEARLRAAMAKGGS